MEFISYGDGKKKRERENSLLSVMPRRLSREYVFRRLEIRVELFSLNQGRTASALGPGLQRASL